MSDWNANQYLKFKEQRTQPALDLANRLRYCEPADVLDVGCGPGNSTAILRSVFPSATIVGIDNSRSMIDTARVEHPELTFRLCDVNDIEGKYDVVFSNACLQWVPNHRTLLPRLMERLKDGGVLAVQMPMNGEEPVFKIMEDLAADSRTALETNGTLEPDEYFDILSSCSRSFQIWETVYYHEMSSHQAIVEWVKGSRLRPYLDALDEERATQLERELLKRVEQTYPIMANGVVILRFRRFFFTAVKGRD